jgi:FtsP/CotA-like multicopper oxidase with cupredoxin domain
MNGRDAAASLVLVMLVGMPTHETHSSLTLPVAAANDNRRLAGVMRGDTLYLDLDVRMARWYPEAADGEAIEAAVVGEVGHEPQVPAPLIRAHEGTIVVARLTNALADSTVTWRGLTARPGNDSITLRPGETRTTRFTIGRAGTYLYSTSAGKYNPDLSEREQGIGAFVAAHAPTTACSS